MTIGLASDVEVVGSGMSGGTTLGASASELVSLHGATPTAQGSTIASVSTSVPVVTTTATTVFGFASSAQLIALIAAVNSLAAIVQTKGMTA